jgi:hypothetical protein
MSKLTLKRRTFLRGLFGGGLAACVGLPILDAMLNSHGEAFADGQPFPKRFMTWCFGNGVRLDRWLPPDTGPAYTLSEELAPLADVKDYFTLLSGFENRAGYPLITHHEGMSAFSGHPMTEQVGLFSKPGGATIDQVAAAAVGSATPFKSLELGVSRFVSTNEGPTLQFLSHKGTNEPCPPEYDPTALFARIFGGFTPQQAKSVGLRVNVLDAVREDTDRLKKRVGTADRRRLDAHLEGIAAIQKQIKALPPVCTFPPAPTEQNIPVNGAESTAAVARVMSDLIAAAFACDLTRVASYMFTGPSGASRFAEISEPTMTVHGATHTTYHYVVHECVLYAMGHFGYLLNAMKSQVEGTGNLLDNTVVFMTSDVAEGYTHSIVDVPIIVAGKGGGKIKTGTHYRSPNLEPVSNVLLSCVQTVAPGVTSVGSKEGLSSTPCAALAV